MADLEQVVADFRRELRKLGRRVPLATNVPPNLKPQEVFELFCAVYAPYLNSSSLQAIVVTDESRLDLVNGVKFLERLDLIGTALQDGGKKVYPTTNGIDFLSRLHCDLPQFYEVAKSYWAKKQHLS